MLKKTIAGVGVGTLMLFGGLAANPVGAQEEAAQEVEDEASGFDDWGLLGLLGLIGLAGLAKRPDRDHNTGRTSSNTGRTSSSTSRV